MMASDRHCLTNNRFLQVYGRHVADTTQEAEAAVPGIGLNAGA